MGTKVRDITYTQTFKPDNMLSENVSKINVCRYFEENWPLDDEDLEIVHELYRLEAYHAVMFSLSFPDFGEEKQINIIYR